MKNCCPLFLLLVLTSCGFNRVDTLYIDYINPPEAREVEMVVKLYQHYMASDKSKEYYEVVSKNRGGILNYNPNKQLLSICVDPGSGWRGQYKGVNSAKLKWIGDNKVSFNQYSKHLVGNPNADYLKLKSNGHP